MKFLDEYRDRKVAETLSRKIRQSSRSPVTIMEVCGGHTAAVHKFGIRSLLPETVHLLSGPGCPVCVTSTEFIDKAVALSRMEDVIITTYGDLIRVPGSSSSLEKEKSAGRSIRMVYSVMEALDLARKNPGNKIIFLGIGFETTAPATALGILEAKKIQLENFFVLSSHKIMPPVMNSLVEDGIRISGFLAPGHVSAITGISMYAPIVKRFRIPVVVSGFEPADILQSILMMVEQIENHEAKVEIQYKRVVKPGGNTAAQKVLSEVFYYEDEWWRGFGIIPGSGLQIREEYERFDAGKIFSINIPEPSDPKGCICGQLLKGLKTPFDCRLFGTTCKPSNPVGACMVSQEGICSAYYNYER